MVCGEVRVKRITSGQLRHHHLETPFLQFVPLTLGHHSVALNLHYTTLDKMKIEVLASFVLTKLSSGFEYVS